MPYQSKYNLDDETNPGSRLLLSIEEAHQKAVATRPEWRIARQENAYNQALSVEDKLELIGFTDIQVSDHLFFICKPPAGWTRNTEGYWTTIKDDKGRDRISMFYKGAIYDQRAHVNFLAFEYDLTNVEDVKVYMSLSTSVADWQARYQAVNAANGDDRPAFWNEEIVLNGVVAKLYQHYGK